MVISQRTIAKREFKRDLQRIRNRVENEMARRLSSGAPFWETMVRFGQDIVRGRWDVRGDQQPSNRPPSIAEVRQTLDLLHTLRAETVAEPQNTPASRNPVRHAELGNAMRNLGPIFSGVTPSNNRREAQRSRSRRTESVNEMRVMIESGQRRTSSNSARRSNEVPLSRDPDIPEYQYNPSSFNPAELTLKQAMKVMITFDFDRYYERIKGTLCTFSLRIYGIDICPVEDLRLAVFLFIEQYFSIQPVIELSIRHISDPHDPNVVGVIFERNGTTKRILDNQHVLDDTKYKVSRNCQADWIIWNYDG